MYTKKLIALKIKTFKSIPTMDIEIPSTMCEVYVELEDTFPKYIIDAVCNDTLCETLIPVQEGDDCKDMWGSYNMVKIGDVEYDDKALLFSCDTTPASKVLIKLHEITPIKVYFVGKHKESYYGYITNGVYSEFPATTYDALPEDIKSIFNFDENGNFIY